MSSKRDAGKQGRQARNQARRQATAARREHAAAPPPTPAGAGGGASRPGRSGPAALTGGQRPVGWRAALAALLMSIAAFVLLATNDVQVDAEGKAIPATELAPLHQYGRLSVASGLQAAFAEEDPPADVAEAIAEGTAGPGDETGNSMAAYWPISLIFPLPVLITAAAFWLIHTQRANGRQLMFFLLGMFLASMLTGVFFLPSLVALGVASFQIRKKEATAAMAARAAAGGGPDGGVIDVDEVDQDFDEDDDLDGDEDFDDEGDDEGEEDDLDDEDPDDPDDEADLAPDDAETDDAETDRPGAERRP
ncbi:MAG: hypothetical protein AB7L84_16325 [Acidimicrobiia bacterium]